MRLFILFAVLIAASASALPAGENPPPATAVDGASRRYDEMLERMRAALEEIAQTYGNPTFAQIFTNDGQRAEELRDRLRIDRAQAEGRRSVDELEKRRKALLEDIELKEREVARLAERIVRQRAALDALASALEQARTAAEGSAH